MAGCHKRYERCRGSKFVGRSIVTNHQYLLAKMLRMSGRGVSIGHKRQRCGWRAFMVWAQKPSCQTWLGLAWPSNTRHSIHRRTDLMGDAVAASPQGWEHAFTIWAQEPPCHARNDGKPAKCFPPLGWERAFIIWAQGPSCHAGQKLWQACQTFPH